VSAQPLPDDVPDPASAAGYAADPRAPQPPNPQAPRAPQPHPYRTAHEAEKMADQELGGTSEIAAIYQMPDGSFCWARATHPDPVNGWPRVVRTYDGLWVGFSRPDHALDFMRVEQSIRTVREHLLRSVSRWPGPDAPQGIDPRALPHAAQLAQTLEVLRNEQELLRPTTG
jgi:hypothetical protein